jgi:hypothetical protein
LEGLILNPQPHPILAQFACLWIRFKDTKAVGDLSQGRRRHASLRRKLTANLAIPRILLKENQDISRRNALNRKLLACYEKVPLILAPRY